MKRMQSSLWLALILSPLTLLATQTEADEPALTSESQFTVDFDQSQGIWTLMGADDQNHIANVGRCREDRKLAEGLWLITRDQHGTVELVAPSVTRLAPGEPDRVLLTACDSSESSALHVPRDLIAQLVDQHGVVLIHD
jgi:hypothetical protein